MKNNLLSVLQKFFFEEVSDFNLGVSRFLFYFTNFIVYQFIYIHTTTSWLEIDRSLWSPVGVFRVFEEPLLLTADMMSLVDVLFPLTLLFSALGLFSRISMPLAFITGFYVLGLSHNFGKIHHSTHLPMLIMFIFCFVRYPGRFSLDSLLFNRWTKIPKKSFEYNWPLALAMVLIGLSYTAAGFQKFRRFGFDWAFSENMEIILLTRTEITDWARLVVEIPYLPQAIAFVGLISQLCGVIFLLVKPLRIGFVLYPIFHISTWFLLGVDGNFNTYLPAFFLLVPWEKLSYKLYPYPQVITPNG